MNNFTFLTEEQVVGDTALDIIKKCGKECEITDFAILLGDFDYLVSNFEQDKGFISRTGSWWTKTKGRFDDEARVVSTGFSSCGDSNINKREEGARIALPLQSILQSTTNEVRDIVVANYSDTHNPYYVDGIKAITYGEYPQYIVYDNILSNELEAMYNNKMLQETGKYYTTDYINDSDKNKRFKPRIHVEYEYNGEKYLRFMGKPLSAGKTLSNGENIIEKKYYWLKVEPLTWLIAEKSNIAISKNIIFSGLPFNKLTNLIKEFNHTDIKRCMDLFLIKDIEPSISIEDKKLISDKLSLVRKK